MRSCENCGTGVELDDNFCFVCGDDLQLQVNDAGPLWTASIEEALCFHWLAQCQRRLRFPIDTTEEIPYVAFEYGWKVVNRLYNELKVPKQTDPVTGKKRKATAKESFVYLLDRFGVTNGVIDENRNRIERLCDCVLETPDPARMQEKRGYITFDEASGDNPGDEDQEDKNPEESKATAVAVCTALRDALMTNDSANTANALADMLLSVRNARVHATIPKPAKRRLGTPGGHTVRLLMGGGDHRGDYEIDETAQIQLSIGQILLGAKTNRPPEDVQNIVNSRVKQIKDEIHERVMKWPRPK